MSTQNAEKRVIGAKATPELWEGVDEWLRRNPGKGVSDFVLSAAADKLERDGIQIDRIAALRDFRTRQPGVSSGPRGTSHTAVEEASRPVLPPEVKKLSDAQKLSQTAERLIPKAPASVAPKDKKPKRS